MSIRAWFLINLSFFFKSLQFYYFVSIFQNHLNKLYILIELNIKMFSVMIYILKINLEECLDGNLDRFNCK